ncbi:MAG: hypothetical protein Q9N68_10960 [Gammaproteobacteria bacterium]|nr:hypothetical protein [Gammaproteobacteria bacterium]
MYLLLSGEGVGDIGGKNNAAEFMAGPMAVMVDHLLGRLQGYEFSYLDLNNESVEYVSETELTQGAQELKAHRKSPSLPGRKNRSETLYYRRNARVFAIRAKEKAAECNDQVVAVLFRDADGTASAGRGDWQAKWDSMLAGFDDEGFSYGVPMIPKPKSEAWLLCALSKDYQHCDALESESGNDNAPHSLKTQLARVLAGEVSAQGIADRVREHNIDVCRIDMPSFNQFKCRLTDVVRSIVGRGPA